MKLQWTRGNNSSLYTVIIFLSIFPLSSLLAQTTGSIKGLSTDPQGNALPQASVSLVVDGRVLGQATTGVDGRFQLPPVAPGQFDIKVEAPGFRPVSSSVTIRPGVTSDVEISMEQLSARKETLTTTADVNEGDVLQPDAATKVFASEDLLDANPGRPGAPISIPGYPMETASSGIKAPQYFAPGVAGDHGEPIAMFITPHALLQRFLPQEFRSRWIVLSAVARIAISCYAPGHEN